MRGIIFMTAIIDNIRTVLDTHLDGLQQGINKYNSCVINEVSYIPSLKVKNNLITRDTLGQIKSTFWITVSSLALNIINLNYLNSEL